MKTVYFPRANNEGTFQVSSGVDVTFIRSKNRLSIGGFYDHYVGIESDEMSLRDFFEYVGIRKVDCDKAWREP